MLLLGWNRATQKSRANNFLFIMREDECPLKYRETQTRLSFLSRCPRTREEPVNFVLLLFLFFVLFFLLPLTFLLTEAFEGRLYNLLFFSLNPLARLFLSISRPGEKNSLFFNFALRRERVSSWICGLFQTVVSCCNKLCLLPHRSCQEK